MTVKLNTSLAGANFSHAAGETVTLDPDFETRLINSGQAEKVAKKSPKSAKNETKSNDSAD